ncbi:hypothetical protein AB6G58_18665 [Providencia huaxiensis]
MSVKLSSYVWDGCASAGLKITSVAIMAVSLTFQMMMVFVGHRYRQLLVKLGQGKVLCALQLKI